MEALSIGLALMATVVSLLLIAREVRHTGEFVTPWSVVLAMSVFDIFLAALVFLAWGTPRLPLWARRPDAAMLLDALCANAVALVFFRIGYVLAIGRESLAPSQPGSPGRVNVTALYAALLASGAVYLAYLQGEVARAGSLDEYITEHLKVRWEPKARVFNSLYETLVNQLAPAALPSFITTAMIFFYYRKRYGHPILWGVVVPLVAWLGTLTTFFRGTQLAFFLALLTTESLRLEADSDGWRGRERARRFLGGLLIAGVLLFGGYGIARDYSSREVQGEAVTIEESRNDQAEQVIAGHGLIGLYSILDHYPRLHDFFEGKTIIDMLLLPVPRYIYRSKPEWYGIDDITRGMGWPESTQSAVTIPGELYANFGYAGLPFAAFYGVFFGFCYRFRRGPRFRFIYSFTVPVLLLVTQWMAFTGLMNCMTWLPAPVLILLLVIRGDQPSVARPAPRLALRGPNGVGRSIGSAPAA